MSDATSTPPRVAVDEEDSRVPGGEVRPSLTERHPRRERTPRTLARHPAVLVLLGLLFGAGLLLIALRTIEERPDRQSIFALVPPGAGLLFEVDCGGPTDRPFDGTVGWQGGRAVRYPPRQLRQAAGAPAAAHLTARVGGDLGYRFRVGRGWVEIELRFLEREHHRPGARTFSVALEDTVVVPELDLLGETYPDTVLVRRWAVFVADGTLDLRLRGVRGEATVDFIRVRRLGLPAR